MFSRTRAISQRITPNVPLGMTAPVAIPTASPKFKPPLIGRPALTSPTIFQGPFPDTA